MARTGRPPKPTEVKRRTGNPGKRPLPAASTVTVLKQSTTTPKPPRALLAAGLRLWNDAWSTGVHWISETTDLELLLMTCEQVDERAHLRTHLMSFHPEIDEALKMRKALRDLERDITKNLSLLGFTPTDRSRLGLAEVKAVSKLEDLAVKRAKRGTRS